MLALSLLRLDDRPGSGVSTPVVRGQEAGAGGRPGGQLELGLLSAVWGQRTKGAFVVRGCQDQRPGALREVTRSQEVTPLENL